MKTPFSPLHSFLTTVTVVLTVILSGCQTINQPDKNSNTENDKSVRQAVTLAGDWRFQLDIRDIGEKEKWYEKDNSAWGSVVVPLAWNCYEEGLFNYEGIGWYSTGFTPDQAVTGKKSEIVFGRVMYYTKVWINGEFIGENIGGYLPFSFDVTKYLKPGQENKLVMRVDNRPRINWLPAAEQIEWIQYGGILQPVTLVTTPQIYLDNLTIRTIPEKHGALVNCIITVANETSNEDDMDLTIDISRNTTGLAKSVKIRCKPNDTTNVNVAFNIEDAELWSPETPALYTASVSLSKNGQRTDDLNDRFGIRQVRVEGTSILLNGKPVTIKGTHRYDAYDRLGPNPPDSLLRKELALMKSVGINTIRVHYPASPELLNLYDEYGFMMLEEIPLNWWGNKWDMTPIGGKAEQSLDILDQAKSTLGNMIARDKNHPCIIIWSMANECATDNEIGITVMRTLLKLAKSLDPTRLTTFVAGDNPIKHLAFDEADVVGFNAYFVCDHIQQMDSVITQPLSRHMAEYRNFFNKPIIMTEFGRQGIKGIHGDSFYSEEFQAAYIESNWKAIIENPTISGGILWTWADYFHEQHFSLHTSYGFYGVVNANYGPFGVVTGDRKHKKSLESLARMYGGTIPVN
jgi:beta-galactosidase/beta-glucuronidase